MKIINITNQTFTVERGFNNSIIQIHGVGTSVQKLVTDTDMKAVRGYALFRGEKGYSFSVSLGKEESQQNLVFQILVLKTCIHLSILKFLHGVKKANPQLRRSI